MKEKSSLYVVPGDVDLRKEASDLYERTIDILSAMLLYSSNLDDFCQEIEDRVGKRGFKKVLENLSNAEKGIIVNHANHVLEMMECTKKLMYSHKK